MPNGKGHATKGNTHAVECYPKLIKSLQNKCWSLKLNSTNFKMTKVRLILEEDYIVCYNR